MKLELCPTNRHRGHHICWGILQSSANQPTTRALGDDGLPFTALARAWFSVYPTRQQRVMERDVHGISSLLRESAEIIEYLPNVSRGHCGDMLD